MGLEESKFEDAELLIQTSVWMGPRIYLVIVKALESCKLRDLYHELGKNQPGSFLAQGHLGITKLGKDSST